MSGGTGTGRSYQAHREVPMRSPAGNVFHQVHTRVSNRSSRWPKGLSFVTTNESLEAIIDALEPTEEDIILAICGCGDQPFALAQTGARVHAVDYKKEQITYAKRRARLVKLGRHVDFLSVDRDSPGQTDNLVYLADEERWQRIRSNIDNVSFHHADIFELPQSLHQPYTKIYLSNVTIYGGRNPKNRELDQLTRVLQPNGLLYMTATSENIGISGDIRKQLRLDLPSTYDARRTEKYWAPFVYRRV